MAIVVTPPTHCGPGYLVAFSGLTGPVPVTDFFQVRLSPTGLATWISAGVVTTFGATAGFVVMGKSIPTLALADSLTVYVAPGASMDLEWTQFHASFAVVATGTNVAATLWDPLGGIYSLITDLYQTGGISGAAILSAVQKNLPSLP